MTAVGWRRANQLAKGENLSLDTVKRMAQFNRHRKNAKIDPKHKNEPWKDAGYVAWLGWGGDSGIDWAMRISEQEKEKALIELGELITKAGARNARVDLGRLQQIHDLTVELGVDCAGRKEAHPRKAETERRRESLQAYLQSFGNEGARLIELSQAIATYRKQK